MAMVRSDMPVAHGIATALAERRPCRARSYNRCNRRCSSITAAYRRLILRDRAAFAATVFKRQQIVAAIREQVLNYWFGTCGWAGVAGVAGALGAIAGAFTSAAGGAAGAAAGAVLDASLPDGGVGVVPLAGGTAGAVEPGNWPSMPLPSCWVAEARSRMSIGFSP
jgi:hypothetical protein